MEESSLRKSVGVSVKYSSFEGASDPNSWHHLRFPLLLCTSHNRPWYLHLTCSPLAQSSQQAPKSQPRGLLFRSGVGLGRAQHPQKHEQMLQLILTYPSNSPPRELARLTQPRQLQGTSSLPLHDGGSRKAAARSGQSGSSAWRCLGTVGQLTHAKSPSHNKNQEGRKKI